MNDKTVQTTTSQDNTKTTSVTTSRFRLYPRVIQNFILIWLDPNMHGVLDEEHQDVLNQVRSIINTINIFSDANQCLSFLQGIKDEKAFMIVSGIFGEATIPYIHDMSKLDSIYVFCGVKSKHENWAKNWSKIKGVFTQIAPICDLLKNATQKCEQDFISLSFVSPSDVSDHNVDQLDQSFMYTQILKEILLDIEYNDQTLKDLVSFCRDLYANNPNECKVINEFEADYSEHSPIYWYTHPGFIYSILNRALRTHEVNTIIKMGFFIQALHKEISKLYIEQTQHEEKQSFIVYRGQGLSKMEFEKLSKAKGGLMSFNNFLSTSKKRDISLEFAQDALKNLETIGVLFKMVIDPSELATPYALIDDESYFKSEEEILFSMHTVFRIGEIKSIQKNDRLYQVILTLTNSKNKQLITLIDLLREETRGSTGWHRLGMLLIKLGQFNKAEQVYRALLDLTKQDNDKALLNHQLGLIKRNQGDYKNALEFYEKALEIYQKTHPINELDLATTYNNMGQVYTNMGQYSKALSYYQQSLDIYLQHLPEDHPTLAILYNNIGVGHKNLGVYLQALESYEKALKIEEKTLPPTHPSLASSYKNLGSIFRNLGEYSKALDFHEKALDIEQKILPIHHPSLAISYNNLGLLYDTMGDYLKALSSYEKTLEIYQEILPSNHPDFALCYNNIGSAYKNIGDYPRALSFYRKTLDLEQRTFSTDHPSLAISYSNIGLVYDRMKDYERALSFHEKALDICQKSLSIKHPILAVSYNNYGAVHDSMGDYTKALLYYEKTLEIEREILPSNHPHLATSYNNIGLVYNKLDEHIKALTSHEKAMEIYEKTLPSNHPDLANSYNNIALTYQKLNEYSKAFLFYEKVLAIYQKILPANHLDLNACYGNLCQLCEILGEHSKALSFYEQISQADEKILPKDQSESTVSLSRIDQIYNSKQGSSKISFSSKSLIVVEQQFFGEKPFRLTKFRNKLAKIALKISES